MTWMSDNSTICNVHLIRFSHPSFTQFSIKPEHFWYKKKILSPCQQLGETLTRKGKNKPSTSNWWSEYQQWLTWETWGHKRCFQGDRMEKKRGKNIICHWSKNTELFFPHWDFFLHCVWVKRCLEFPPAWGRLSTSPELCRWLSAFKWSNSNLSAYMGEK